MTFHMPALVEPDPYHVRVFDKVEYWGTCHVTCNSGVSFFVQPVVNAPSVPFSPRFHHDVPRVHVSNFRGFR